MVVRIVFEPLGAYDWGIEPIRKLLNVIGPSLGSHEFVISDREKHRSIAKRFDLLRDEITPLNFLVLSNSKVLGPVFRCGEHIFVEVGAGAEIAQVPVKLRLIFAHSLGNRRHDDVAAISGVSRDGKGPSMARLRGQIQTEAQ